MRSVKVQCVLGFKHKQWLSEEVIKTCNWKKVCALWKYTEWWASRRKISFQKKFFKTLYTFKHTIEQRTRSVKVQWLVGFKQKQCLSEEVFQNIIHIQTYNWTKYAICESSVSGGFQAQAMAFRRNHWNIIHIQTYNWTKYTRCGSTLCGGLQGEKLAFRRSFSRHYTHSNLQLNDVCALWKYTEWWDSSRSNAFQKKVFKTLQTFKHTIEQSKRSVEVQWVVGFKEKD